MTHRPLSVRTNCNLDLQLAPAGIDSLPAMGSGDDTSSITIEMTHRPLSVRTNCNLDLQLPPAGIDFLPAMGSGDDTTTERSAVETPQQLTIFYNGRVCVYDVTELQARAIILTARREMEERMNTPRSEPITPLESQLHSPEGFPMKRSLQQFLQKRKNRIQATSPYKQS